MKIYKYENYEQYVEAQTEANVRKLQLVWVQKSTIHKICLNHPYAASVICHGTRNAREQIYFQEFLPNAKILGTEISHTASKFPMTVEHDFHEPRDEWLKFFDIVYSNSFDHSYDPQKSLKTWSEQMSQFGSLYIEHGYLPSENKSKASDPLEISQEEIIELCGELGLKHQGYFGNDKGNARIHRFMR